MGGSCAKLAIMDSQKGQKKQEMTTSSSIKIMSVSEKSNKEQLSNHDLMKDKFNEIEKGIGIEIAMIKEKLRSQENEIQLRKDKLQKMEMDIKRKMAEIA